MVTINVIVNSIIYAVEPCLWIRTMSVMARRFSNKLYYILVGVGYYGISLVKQYFAYFHKSEMVEKVIILLMGIYVIGVSLNFFVEKAYKKITLLGMFLFIISCFEFVVFAFTVWIIKIPVEVVMSFGTVNTICTVVSKLGAAMVLTAYWHQRRFNVMVLFHGRKEFVFLMLILVVTFHGMSSVLRTKNVSSGKELILLLGIMQIILILNCIYFWVMVRKKEAQLMETELELSHMRSTMDVTTKLKRLEHDLGTHASIISDMVHNKRYVELEKYLADTFGEIKAAKNVCTLSDYAVSSVINNLNMKAAENGICFTRHIMMDQFYIPSKDVCGIIANMVNNAFEATEKLPRDRRYVSLDIFPVQDGYKITCLNPFEAKQEIFKTTKKNKDKHGLGIGIIKELTERNGGVVEIVLHNNNWFEITSFIALKNKSLE